MSTAPGLSTQQNLVVGGAMHVLQKSLCHFINHDFWLRFHAVSGAYSPLISLFGDVADVDTARCTAILSNRMCFL